MTIETWAAVAVAVGTTMLAGATFWLGWSTRGMASATRGMAAETAKLAAETKRLGDETKRIADSGEEQVSLLRANVGIEEERRRDELVTKVTPESWNGRTGVKVANASGTPSQVFISLRLSEDAFMRLANPLPQMAPGQTRDIAEGLEPFTPDDIDAIPAVQTGYRVACVSWTNEDGTPGSSGWVQIREVSRR